MATCDVLALFTTSIHSGIKDSTSAFNGSYGRCGQNDQLHSFEQKNHRFFQSLVKEIGAQHVGLLFYIKVRWLSRDKCLSRLYELKNEGEIFLRENKNNLHVLFHNGEFVVMLAYLADVFGHLNDMSLYLQGRDVTVNDVKDKLAGTTVRMAVWQARFKVESIFSFLL